MTHFGISTALLTPFHTDGAIHLQALLAHANSVLANGADGVTLFGTTGEGASIGYDERAIAISALLDSGIPADKITLGVCACAVSDALAQVRQGLDVGITRFLLLPPFYFKGSEDDGLFIWHQYLFEAAGPSAKFILYHIPQLTQVPLSVDLVSRLRRAFPERIVAIKDSAGQWDNTQAFLESGVVPVLVGDERLLHRAAALGAAGSICGMANLYPRRMQNLFTNQTEDTALSAEVSTVVSVPFIPALKHVMSVRTGNGDWANLRAPLRPLSAADMATIDAEIRGVDAA